METKLSDGNRKLNVSPQHEYTPFQFVVRCFYFSTRKTWGVLEWWTTPSSIVAGFALWYWRGSMSQHYQNVVNDLGNWIVPTAVFVCFTIVRLVCSPFYVWKEACLERDDAKEKVNALQASVSNSYSEEIWQSLRKIEVEKIDLAQRTSDEAKQKAEALHSLIAPRTVTESQREIIVQGLKGANLKEVTLAYYYEDEEACFFADKICEALKGAALKCTIGKTDRYMKPGLSVIPNDELGEKNEIFVVLKKAGLEPYLNANYKPPMTFPDGRVIGAMEKNRPAHIYVGKRVYPFK